MNQPLQDIVAVVAGPTRGCGRAIAIELGTLGATVYIAGRTTRSQRSEMNRPETIEDTAELVTKAGGNGIPVRCDFLQHEDVTALRQGITGQYVDILVNDVWGGDHLTEWDKPFWENDVETELRMWRNGLETHFRSLHALLPLVIRASRGLVVEVTDGDQDRNSGVLLYDQVKNGIRWLASGLSEQLLDRGVTTIGATPGFLRSEAMLDHFGVTEENWNAGIATDPYFAVSESPYYLGRGLAALAADPERARWNGQIVTSWGLAQDYDIRDIDGSQPRWGQWFADVYVTGSDPTDFDPRDYR